MGVATMSFSDHKQERAGCKKGMSRRFGHHLVGEEKGSERRVLAGGNVQCRSRWLLSELLQRHSNGPAVRTLKINGPALLSSDMLDRLGGVGEEKNSTEKEAPPEYGGGMVFTDGGLPSDE
ncbi:hypothetical protein L1887_15008 [Cichorium endivia]|nr:hypothetical protein L1887_15008 [Cichorium endivia]